MNHDLDSIRDKTVTHIGKGLIFLVFIVISIIYVQWTWTGVIGQFGGDNAWYLHTAKFLSPYSLHTEATLYFAKYSPYPPLVPIILALSGGAESIYVAHLVTVLFLLGSFVLLYIWASRVIDSKMAAIGVVLVFASSSMTYMHALEILSENYYLFFCLLSLVLVEYARKREAEFRVLMLASLLAGAAVLVRSIGVSMICAFVIYIWINHPVAWRGRLYVILFSPLLLSKSLNFKVDNSSSYVDMMSDKLSTFNSLSDVTAHFYAHIERFIYAWVNLFGVSTTGGIIIVGVTGILSVVGLAVRIKGKHLDGLYVLMYFLVILLWPFAFEAERYLYPVVAIMIVHGIYIIHITINRTKIFFLIAILASNAPAVAWTYGRYAEDLPDKYSAYRHTSIWYRNKRQVDYRGIVMVQTLTEAMQAIKQVVPEDQCVYAIKPSIVGLFSERVSIQPPLQRLSDQEFSQAVEDIGCRYFITLPFPSITYSVPFYPIKRIKENVEQVFLVKHNDVNYAALYKLKD